MSPDARTPPEPDWSMGCGVPHCDAETSVDGVPMPEGWGMGYAGEPTGWIYLCPVHNTDTSHAD